MTCDPGNFHFAKMYPLREPRTADSTAATTASTRERPSAGARTCQAACQPSTDHVEGSFQAVDWEYSDGRLKLVTSSAYSGVSTSTEKKTSSTYRSPVHARCAVVELRTLPGPWFLCLP